MVADAKEAEKIVSSRINNNDRDVSSGLADTAFDSYHYYQCVSLTQFSLPSNSTTSSRSTSNTTIV